MILNLSDPLTGTIAGGIVLMIIGGTYHYILILIRLNITDKKFSNIFSELESLQKNHKEEIADIKKRHNKEMVETLERSIDLYNKKMDKFLQDNRPPRLLNYYNQYAPSKK